MPAGDEGTSRPRPHVAHVTAFDVRWRCFAERTHAAFVGCDRPLHKTVAAHDGRLQITSIMITYHVFIIMSRYLKSFAGRVRFDVGHEPNSRVYLGGSGGFPPRTRGTSVPRVQRSGGQQGHGTNAVSVVSVLSEAEFSLAAATRSEGQHGHGTNAVSVVSVLPVAECLTERRCARQKTKRSLVFCLDHRSGVYKQYMHR